ncbi:MAG: sulfatase family protein [Opitutales bacterium]
MNFITTLCRLIAVWTTLCGLAFANESRPNIVFIFQDDLGYGDLASYGHPYAKTPNLDRLASEGTSFMQHYVTGVTCNPSRTGLMTGIYPARYEKYAAFFGFQGRDTITSLLKTRGYTTGHFGKWHIGPKETEVDGMYGIDSVNVIGSTKTDPEGRDAGLFREAIDFIKENKDQPFYVNIWGHSTHFPVSVVPELASEFIEVKVKRSDFSDTMQKKFDECIQIGGDLDDSMRQYLGDVYSVDINVGHVLDTLDELGIADNTIVVFSSDHGPAPVILGKGHRKYSNNMLGYAGILRGSKHNLFEGGTRVPFIIRWPGKVPAGKRNTESVTSFIDWLPTLANITGIETLPNDLDGQDVSDIWMGSERTRETPLFWKVSSERGTPVIRDGDWKLHLPPTKNRGEPELYNLREDPAEKHNLAQSEPKKFEELKAKLLAWNAELPSAYIKKAKKK